MSWVVTLNLVRCDAMTTHLAGVGVSSGTLPLGSTDANGVFILVVDDIYDWVILTFRKSGMPGYLDKNDTITKSVDAGKTKVVCMNEAPPSTATGEGATVCFIVSATTGSPASAEVQELRQLRDRVSATSLYGRRLIDEIYREYAQFAPKIAGELEQNDFSRSAALKLAVQPLLAWYRLAGLLAFGPADQDTARRAAQDVVAACPRYFGGGAVLSVLEAIRSDAPLPAHTPELLKDLPSKLAQLPFARWAILDPLIRAWRAALEHGDVVDEVAQWLATAPVDALTLCAPCGDLSSLDREMDALAGFYAFKPDARRQLGQRLLAAWPQAASALAHSDFTAQAQTPAKDL